ncbi:MAG: thioredoxin domain-containing protein, partial [Candidatus Diapherotrites archaeon]
IIAALIIATPIVMLGNDITGKLTTIAKNIEKIKIETTQEINEKNTTTGNEDIIKDAESYLKSLADEGPVIGKSDAPVTIVIFTDFSCPFCAAASGMAQEYVGYMKKRDPNWIPPIPNLMEEYVKTGKARLAIKYFPGHGTGQEAFKVGLCINEQNADMVFKYHDLVFAKPEEANDITKLKDIAKKVGANMADLEKCLSSKKYDTRLEEDYKAGIKLGVGGTPTFFVNNIKIVGAESFSNFKSLIDDILNKK